MAGLFSKPSVPSMPKVPPPPALPIKTSEPADQAARLASRRAGFAKTILTGDLEPKTAGKKTLLGG